MPDFKNTIKQNGVAVSLAGHSHGPATSGTSFPASPATNDLFYRSDLDMQYRWNGVRWLSELQRASFNLGSGVTSVPEMYYALGSGYNIFIKKISALFYITGTNNASNYWRFMIYSITSSETLIDTRSSAVSSAGVWSLDENPAVNTLATTAGFHLSTSKVGVPGPGTLDGSFTVYYQLTT
jgi:hypothetical protein